MVGDDPEIDFQPYALMQSDLRHIGEIVTAGAEIEQVVSLALFKVIGLDPLDGFTLFGSSSIGTRIVALRTVLRQNSEQESLWRAFEKIDSGLTEAVAVRNMFAHGTLLGYNDGFLGYSVLQKVQRLDEETAGLTIKRFRLSEFKARARQAESLLKSLKETFDVQAIHERYVLRLQKDRKRNAKGVGA